jgi:hypothetical protein
MHFIFKDYFTNHPLKKGVKKFYAVFGENGMLVQYDNRKL